MEWGQRAGNSSWPFQWQWCKHLILFYYLLCVNLHYCATYNIFMIFFQLKQAVSFLHDLGTLQFFDREILREMVVINPQWITDVMACIVSVKNSPIVNGIFKHDDVGSVWKNFPNVDTQWLLRLTEEFDLTFRQTQQAANIVPCLLPDDEPNVRLVTRTKLAFEHI